MKRTVNWNPVSVDETIAYLNNLVHLDPEAMHALVETRHPCNKALGDHPTVQVGPRRGRRRGIEVGMLGIINGMFGVDSEHWGAIVAQFNGEGKLIGFCRSDDPTVTRNPA
jgi:hypothetical protein